MILLLMIDHSDEFLLNTLSPFIAHISRESSGERGVKGTGEGKVRRADENDDKKVEKEDSGIDQQTRIHGLFAARIRRARKA